MLANCLLLTCTEPAFVRASLDLVIGLLLSPTGLTILTEHLHGGAVVSSCFSCQAFASSLTIASLVGTTLC